ncbi:MAG: VWA domain-containing protein [Candidatus Binatia bacterium]
MFSTLPPFDFSRPDLLPLFGILPLFWLWQWRAFLRFSSFFSLLLHSLVVALLILAAAGLHTFRPGAASIPLLVIDLSRSVTDTQRQWIQDTIEQQLHPAADTPTILFAGTQQQVPWKDAQSLIARPPEELQPEVTNIEGALALLLHEAQNRHVYLFSDGWEVSPNKPSAETDGAMTEASIRALLPLLQERQLKVYPFLFPPPAVVPNIALQRFSIPQSTIGGETVQAQIALENTNTRPVRGELTVKQKEKVVWQQTVTLAPGASLLNHAITFAESDQGLIPLRATFVPSTATEDTLRPDNNATAWINVTPKEKEILLVSAKARDNRYLEQVLDNRGLGVTTINLPAPIPALDNFRTIILNNVARTRLPPMLLSGLDNFVRQGGGLLMIGGEESLGLGGYKGTEVEQVLPVTVTPPKKEEHTTAVMLVIDTSGSMRRESKLLYAKEGARAVVRNLKDRDFFGVIGFDTEPFPVIPLSRLGDIRGDIESRLARLKASGGTFLLPAIEEAKRQLERQTATRKHLIILTDGETGGSGSQYLDLVSAMHREQKMTISAIAVGAEPNLRLLSRIADYGGGAFHHTVDPSSLPDLFIGEVQSEKPPEEKTMIEQELRPITNPSSPLLQELTRQTFPPVKGYVETQVKPGARADLTLRTDGKRPPLLASWSYGKGKSVAFTSDANGRWSAPWIGWDGFGKFWERAVRWSLPPDEKRDSATKPQFEVALGHTDNGLVIDVFSYGAREEGRSAFAQIRSPSGTAESLALQRLAPGHYQGVKRTETPGDYRVEVTLPSGENLGPLGYTLPPRRATEVPQPQPNMPLLEALAQATAGAINPNVSALEQPVAPPEPQPLLPYLIPLAMALYFLELLVRRAV